MILYKNTKVKVRSLDGDTYYFDICSRCAARRHISPIPLYHLSRLRLRTSIDKMKDNGFNLTQERSRRYPAQTITDADHADDIALLANTPTQAETLLHNLERAAAGIGLHVNSDKTKYMWFNRRGDISTLNGSSLKVGDKFSYLGSSVSSTEKNINSWQAKHGQLSIGYRSYGSETWSIKQNAFFQAAVVSILLYGCTT